MGKTYRKDQSFRPKKHGRVFVKDRSKKHGRVKDLPLELDPDPSVLDKHPTNSDYN